ncbi:MAG: AAA family ATPase [Aquificae bacterium]|nr:AAA family ATPase [Aquificota bacterium]
MGNSFIEFFGFRDNPFNITPDVDFFFTSSVHQEALSSLEYLLETEEGFAVIIGEPGTGKTITIRKFLSQLPQNVEYAYILFPNLSPEEMFKAILEDFGIDIPENASKNRLFSLLRDFLVEKKKEGKKVLVIVDEAQNLPVETLEELRLLSNLETDKEKLIQIILLGQPELERKLNLPQLRQLKQRITVVNHLNNLSKEEVEDYINYRLAKAGNSSIRISPKAYDTVFRYSGGNLRLINQLMERALMSAFIKNKHSIDRQEVEEAAVSLGFESPKTSRWKLLTAGILLLAVSLGAGLYYLYLQLYGGGKTAETTEKAVVKQEEKEVKVETAPPPPPPEEEEEEVNTGTVAVERLNMREKPSTDSRVLKVLKKGDKVEIIGQEGKWLKVKQGEVEGWVDGRFIKQETQEKPLKRSSA